MKRVWITGAAGFTGRHLIEFLRSLSEPLHLVGLDLQPTAPQGLDEYHQVDLTEPAELQQLVACKTPHRVIHLAGLLPPAAEPDLWRVNVGGTLNLLHAVAGSKTRGIRMLTVGSAAEYLRSSARLIRETDPAGGITSYGRTKWAQSTLGLAFGEQAPIDVVVARTFNLIGPGVPPSLVPGALCAQFANGQKKIKVGKLDFHRDFIDIRDAVAAYWKICEKGKPGAIYNVCAGKTASIRKLVHLFSKYAGPRKIEENAGRSRSTDLVRVCGDNSRLRGLGWAPTIPLGKSVRDMLDETTKYAKGLTRQSREKAQNTAR